MEFSSYPTQLKDWILSSSNLRRFPITLSADFKLAIIEAYYENVCVLEYLQVKINDGIPISF